MTVSRPKRRLASRRCAPPGCGDHDPRRGAPAAIATSFTFTGTVSAGGTAFRSHTFPVTESSVITATLDWNDPSADLNLFLYNPERVLREGDGRQLGEA